MIFSKIKEAFSSKINNIFKSHEDIDEIIDEIEELLILSDVGMKTTSEICNKLRKDLLKEDDTSKEHVIELLKEQMVNILTLEDAKEFDTKKNVI
ncbi:MAG: signal recognition particle receptor subunit alpha, partial [Clostridia bacterium]|nr:signal recognition particle receptor subunit alpha [Clostridia bacterium]